jgi:hypothetical protein
VEGIKASGVDLPGFIRTGVVSGLRQLLEFGLFHGDPHPGNIFALRDGRIAYVDFGNVAELSQRNKEVGAGRWVLGGGWGGGGGVGVCVVGSGWVGQACRLDCCAGCCWAALLPACRTAGDAGGGNLPFPWPLPRNQLSLAFSPCHTRLQVLIDAVVHAVNKDYPGMAGDFIKLGFLAQGALTVGGWAGLGWAGQGRVLLAGAASVGWLRAGAVSLGYLC